MESRLSAAAGLGVFGSGSDGPDGDDTVLLEELMAVLLVELMAVLLEEFLLLLLLLRLNKLRKVLLPGTGLLLLP